MIYPLTRALSELLPNCPRDIFSNRAFALVRDLTFHWDAHLLGIKYALIFRVQLRGSRRLPLGKQSPFLLPPEEVWTKISCTLDKVVQDDRVKIGVKFLLAPVLNQVDPYNLLASF